MVICTHNVQTRYYDLYDLILIAANVHSFHLSIKAKATLVTHWIQCGDVLEYTPAPFITIVSRYRK